MTSIELLNVRTGWIPFMLLTMFVSCNGPSGRGPASIVDSAIDGRMVLGVVRPGTSVAELERNCQVIDRGFDILVEPAQFLPGGSGRLLNGTEITFGLIGDRVAFISTGDARLRFDGLGVGSAYADIKKSLGAPRTEYKLGYGTLVFVDEQTALCFGLEEGAVRDTSKVQWIEMRYSDDDFPPDFIPTLDLPLDASHAED